MAISLNSFLQTHPYKRKDYLEHICGFLKISRNGTAETLRARIVVVVVVSPGTEVRRKPRTTGVAQVGGGRLRRKKKREGRESTKESDDGNRVRPKGPNVKRRGGCVTVEKMMSRMTSK